MTRPRRTSYSTETVGTSRRWTAEELAYLETEDARRYIAQCRGVSCDTE